MTAITTDTEHLTYYGDAVKAMPNYMVGGFGVLFTGPGDPDLQREYFTPRTDFDLEDRKSVRVLYRHGVTPEIGPRQLTRATFEVHDKGIFFKAKLDEKEPFQAKLYEKVQEGKIGFSTGSASHVVTRTDADQQAKEITSWPLIEVSLTPMPVEPRARVVTLKSLMLDETRGEDQWLRFQEIVAESLGAEIDSQSSAYRSAVEKARGSYEQQALDIYMQTLMWEHEQRMRELAA